MLVLPGADGAHDRGALFGLGKGDDEFGALGFGALARALPEGDWHFASKLDDPTLAAIGLEARLLSIHALRQEAWPRASHRAAERRRRGARRARVATPSS